MIEEYRRLALTGLSNSFRTGSLTPPSSQVVLNDYRIGRSLFKASGNRIEILDNWVSLSMLSLLNHFPSIHMIVNGMTNAHSDICQVAGTVSISKCSCPPPRGNHRATECDGLRHHRFWLSGKRAKGGVWPPQSQITPHDLIC